MRPITARHLWLLAVLTLPTLSACGGGSSVSSSTTSEANSWMNGEVQEAWADGYRGQGTSITVVDQYSGSRLNGNLGGVTESRTHGGWTSLQALKVAQGSTVIEMDYDQFAQTSVPVNAGLDVINNSYSLMGAPSTSFNALPGLEKSIVSHAADGTAVVVKSAGNESFAMGTAESDGRMDVLGKHLVGKDSAIFVGALDKNGTPTDKASLAYYSNFAGSNTNVQSQFLVVGVDSSATGLAGTSFAAPIVSGYAAILGSKFTTATPKQIADQLLNTARSDTIQGYSTSIHGRGEASIKRALAPGSLN
jgi:subtilisin family serine protease